MLPRPDHPVIYYDYNATTPLDRVVRGKMISALDEAWGNPSSIHRLGRLARAVLDESRERLAATLRCKPSEIVFTSGGTEANNLAIFGAARRRAESGRHLICSAIEHHAVLHAFKRLAEREGFTLTILPVDSSGRVDPATVERSLRPDTVLVSVMAANNETGAIQPVAEIGALCRERGVLFHSDALQWFGKMPFSSIHDFNADLVTLCGHKYHGPKGAGALFVRSPLHIEPLLVGGSHENERRAGTENLPAIVGFVEATSLFVPTPAFDAAILKPWTDRLLSALSDVPGVTLQCPAEGRLANTVAFSVEDADSTGLLAALDLAGICASSGSACAVGSLEPSHVLLAQGASPAAAASLVRLSLGRENTADELEFALRVIPDVVAQVRDVGISL